MPIVFRAEIGYDRGGKPGNTEQEVERMVNVDISNIWEQYSLGDLLNLEKDVYNAHRTLLERKGTGSEYLGWLDLPVFEATDEMRRIVAAAKRIRESSDIFVVVGMSSANAASVTMGKTVGKGDFASVKPYARTLQLIFLGNSDS